MVTQDKKINELWELIKEVPDPEIPVLTLTDLGIVREITMSDEKVEVTITPTYTGCPAMKVFEEDITAKLNESGYKQVSIKTSLSPAWSTDWMSEEGKEKLMKYGISPPMGSSDKSVLTGIVKNVPCPQCKSTKTELVSQFGSTPCKALYQCSDCKEPFDYFKCI
ncbi:MAG TPA: phenylacetate-CoA oxygenase subunit PaaJ [Flavobacteriales bacterium]|nr:phenylacetate-CoA oxygenase subunit PaaJ [Flavobacteriales bacterium]